MIHLLVLQQLGLQRTWLHLRAGHRHEDLRRILSRDRAAYWNAGFHATRRRIHQQLRFAVPSLCFRDERARLRALCSSLSSQRQMEQYSGGSRRLGEGEHPAVFRCRVRWLWVSLVDGRLGEWQTAGNIFSARELLGGRASRAICRGCAVTRSDYCEPRGRENDQAHGTQATNGPDGRNGSRRRASRQIDYRNRLFSRDSESTKQCRSNSDGSPRIIETSFSSAQAVATAMTVANHAGSSDPSTLWFVEDHWLGRKEPT
jgi:hypothetical protein